MAFEILDYQLGNAITAGVTYKLPTLSHSAVVVSSTYQDVILEVVNNEPADEKWSNITDPDYVVKGNVISTMLDLEQGKDMELYFRVTGKAPAVQYATIAIRELGFDYPTAPALTVYNKGSYVGSGYHDISALVSPGDVYTLSVVEEGQEVDTPRTTQPVINIMGVNGTKVTSVMREAQQGSAQFPFIPDSTKTIVHLSAPEGVKYILTVQKVNFGSASGGSFDPTQDADVTGTWSFSNVSGLTMKDEAPILLGQGDNALKIHGTGAGKAVIEGGNATKLDVAVPVNLQEPITAQDTLTFDNTTISEPRNSITFNGPNSASVRIAQTADGNLHIGPVKGGGLSIGTNRVVALSNYAYLKGANFESAVTLGSTITVAGLATLSGHAKIKGHIGLGATDGSAEINFTPVATNQLSVLGDQGAHVDIYTPPEASAGAPLAAKDKLLTQGECDARYVLFVQTTQADYDELAVKNPGTIYHTQDTGIFYIGDKQLTTA